MNTGIYIYEKTGAGAFLLQGDKWKLIPEGAADHIFPTLSIPEHVLPALAEELRKQGVNPHQGATEGKLEATLKHLEDMRTLVFSKQV